MPAYGHRLLAISADRSRAFEEEIGQGCDGVKPGWTRVNLNYFFSAATAEFIAGAVELIAQSGARLLPDYRFAAESGLWVHEAALARPPLSLLDVGYGADGELRYPRYRDQRGEDSYAETLERAREVLASRPDLPAEDQSGLSAAFEALRWFPLPARCLSAGPSAAPALPAI